MRAVVLVAFVICLSALCACNQQPPAPAVPPPAAVSTRQAQGGPTQPPGQPFSENTPGDAKVVLRQLADFYRQAKTFHVDYSQKVEMDLGVMKTNIDSEATISVERPNRLAMLNKNNQLSVDVVCDGEQLSISMTALKQYTQSAAPKSLDELAANPLLVAGAGGRGPLWEIFSEHPDNKLLEGVTKDSYVGREKIGDVEAHHLKFEQPQFDWEIWVAAKDQPRLVQASFDLTKAMAASGFANEQTKNMKMTSIQQYKNWQFDAPSASNAFAFQPPAGAKKVDSFFAAGSGAEPERSPLVGKPAPDVEQDLLDGSHFSLSEQKGKKIVVLDFWATWCGPCVQEMPFVAKVAEEYKGKDVALYCVNQAEDADTIRAFLADKKLDVTVSLDSLGQAGTAYGVQGIPTLVLVDKAGVVQSVHVGYSPDIADKLKEELDTILSGKDLAEGKNEAPTGDDADTN